MLKPIKTFFNYLQKNANTSNIFRLSNDLNMSEEIPSESLPLEGENGAFEDPLTDPLALDDEYVQQQQQSVDDDENVNNIESIASDTENNSIDNFIFVDIEKLKNKINKNNGTKLEQQQQQLANKKIHTKSDINGNSKHAVNSDSEIVVKTCKVVLDKKQSNTLLDPSTSASSSSSIITEQEKNGHNETINNKNVETNNGFVINASSEAETDEVTDVTDTSSVLLEEIRSDGSDSGLGLDTLRNISVIEKNLATLTPAKSSLKRRSVDALHEDQPKKAKRGNINFGNVMVYYFPRCQGFSCVPTQGGSTLGMTAKHAYKKTFTLVEHAAEQRRLNRLKMAGNELNPSSSSSDESKSEDEISENSLSEADNEAYGFLQPVTARQRRAILKLAGVRKIDSMEKDECRQLRLSREVCGCACNGYCDPDTCECSLAGIKCQVDRLKPHEFPCGCTRDGCANVNGRIEFNPARVKTHFIHTIMRLELEKRQEMSDDNMPTSVIQHHPPPSKWWPQMRLSSTASSSNTPQHSNGNYSSYMYNNSPQQYQNNGKIPPISTISQESLDLHYAYRDDYTMGTETSSNSFATTSNDYYSNYNYAASAASASTSTQSNSSNCYYPHSYHHHHHLGYTTNDCQYSNYSTTAGVASSTSGYRIDNINDYYNTPSSSSVHNGASTSRISYQSVIATTQNQSEIPQTVSESNYNNNNTVQNETTVPTTNESNENLSEIIKKSIVESVTA
ncbi:hypothetical protein PVAND_008976 [Polypedilum vanderplanki]|uniref:Cysteine/serine-rich nuclear protein N-terminal domain-containing protein n=1 Tax=Polypedilum vanderplanki TaxID=319348 RepID=A0A9J6CB88_POLVA|nr:hypothetical protein PVAND_008976 [Polypedilum vanderplanki]